MRRTETSSKKSGALAIAALVAAMVGCDGAADASERVPVELEGELSAVGTLELGLRAAPGPAPTAANTAGRARALRADGGRSRAGP